MACTLTLVVFGCFFNSRYFIFKGRIVSYNNTLYHYYCAVRKYQEGDAARNIDPTNVQNNEFRCITVAISKEI